MNDQSSFDATPDAELGAALRDALAMPFGAAFVGRVRARLTQRQRGWEDELARWFWQGLVAASLVTVLAGWGLNGLQTAEQAESTTAFQLLEGSAPGADVLLASIASTEQP